MFKKLFSLVALSTCFNLVHAASSRETFTPAELCKAVYIFSQFKDLKDLLQHIGPNKAKFAQLTNKDSWNVAHFAAQNNHPEIIVELADFPEILNVQTIEGKTPLMIAIEHNHPLVIHYLLQIKGINVDLCDNEHNSALDYAIQNDHLHLIEPLRLKMAPQITNTRHLLQSTQSKFSPYGH